MIISETTTKSVDSVVCGFVVGIERKGEKYTIKMTPLSEGQTLSRDQIFELADKIKLLANVVSK